MEVLLKFGLKIFGTGSGGGNQYFAPSAKEATTTIGNLSLVDSP